jgi:hypothetical protein
MGSFSTAVAFQRRLDSLTVPAQLLAIQLAEAFIRLNDRALRDAILDMVEAMARKSPPV